MVAKYVAMAFPKNVLQRSPPKMKVRTSHPVEREQNAGRRKGTRPAWAVLLHCPEGKPLKW